MGNGLRAIDFFWSPAEWLLNPLSLNAQGNFVPQPTFADVAEPPPLAIAALPVLALLGWVMLAGRQCGLWQ
jgi:hypothetical protein